MTRERKAALAIDKEEFRKEGYKLIDEIAEFLETIGKRKVTTGESPEKLRSILGEKPLPENGVPVPELLERTTGLLFNHSLFNGHPKFFFYIFEKTFTTVTTFTRSFKIR